jgi:hypothetical protein
MQQEAFAMKASRMVLVALALGAGAAFAGTAEVRFVNPEKFTDIGTYKSDEQANMDTLGYYIRQLATQLPPDQMLRVDVLDVTLAGDVRQTRNGAVRLAREASYPAMRLRWSLESNGHVVRSGDQRITDLN